MARSQRKSVVLASLLMCLSHSAWSAGSQGPALDDMVMDQQTYSEIPVSSIQEFVQIYGIVKDNYIQDKNDDALFQQAIRGLVGGLDRYSRYLSPEDFKQLRQYTEGDLASIDFDLKYNPQLKQWVIQGLSNDADSARQGLRNGVTVFKIDDQELSSLNHEQVRQLLSGAIGSTLSIQLSPQSQVFNLVRNTKVETEIKSQLHHNQVLVLQVKVFQQDTANEIKRIIDSYSGQRLKAVLFDLRNNPGGLLSAAVESADLFLNQGIIVSTKSRAEGDQQFQALPGFEFQNLKIGILINNRSASAAEVFTAALKEHQRAWVVGEKSYGKGVVQKLFPLSNGAALQMTVSQYFSPSGQRIEGFGVQPHLSYPLGVEVREESYLDHITELLLLQK
ncbi:S41 family peptidase [Acinetobacter sp. ASP199]|uniref:S41 family peptidase n=1 Tax=unclassified Acinetobacter TaxID=196816 RepID=UPI001F619EC7|nr:S41 family peptidase [Acinetobacter sp. ASP199]UNT59085.1 S41 family peptidase [Acinetobacter sp. ASP199]